MEETIETKRPLILFSGGLDSALLVMLHLLVGEDCDILKIESDTIHASQQELENQAIGRILIRIRNETYRVRPDSNEPFLKGEVKRVLSLKLAHVKGETVNPAGGFRQVPMWLYGMMLNVNSNRHNGVEIGYIAGDQISGVIHHVQKAWKELWPVIMNDTNNFVPLKFPILERHLTKKGVLDCFNNLKYIHPDLSNMIEDVLDMVHYCENPIITPHGDYVCDRCESCRRVQNTPFHNKRVLKRDELDYSI